MDALDPEEWKCIARMIMEVGDKPFREVVGIPRGGTTLAKNLNEYATRNKKDPICIVDDVLTTGESIKEFKRIRHWRNPTQYIGWVVFARTRCPDWVTALFQMPV